MKKALAHKPEIRILLILLPIALVTPVLFHTLFYLAGLKNQPPCLPMVVGLGCVLLQVVLLPILFTRCAINSYRKPRSLKKTGINALLAIVALVITIGLLLFNALLPAGAVTFLRGFERWTDRNVDMGAIQEWLVTAPASYWGDPCEPDSEFYRAEDELPKELPRCFTEFKRQYVIFQQSELDGLRIVRFEWGGAMFHWSLVVGDPNMKMPELTEEWYSDRDVEFRRILRLGVYVYSRG